MSRGNMEHSLTLAMPCLPSPLSLRALCLAMPARRRRAHPLPRMAHTRNLYTVSLKENKWGLSFSSDHWAHEYNR